MQHAWAPYSNFHVGAAIEAVDGTVYVGCNVESASYGLTICAERMALGAAVVGGARKLKRIVVTTEVDPPAAPCGACRQLLAEFGMDLEEIAVGPATERRWTLAALLPRSGCNVESASYGLTICAERMALGAAVVGGARKLKRIVVTTEVDPPAAPCGACRQLLAEFGMDLEVIAVGPATERRWTLAALLPDAFTKETLDR